MDYRRSLFQIEQWSPLLAKKIWSLTPFITAPFILALGLKIENLTDNTVEIRIPFAPQNKNEEGNLHPAALITASQFASQVLWRRHVTNKLETMTLIGLNSDFHKVGRTRAFIRAALDETEREEILRKMKSGESPSHEMVVVIVDDKNQSLGQINCTWEFKQLRPLTQLKEIEA